MLGPLLSFYDAEAVIVAVADKLSGRTYLTECNPAAEDTRSKFQKILIGEIQLDEKNAFLFAADAHAWHLSLSADRRFKVLAVNARGQRAREFRIPPGGFFWKRPYLESLLAVGVSVGEELSGHLYVLNPRLHASREAELAFMQRFSVEVTPAIYNVYLWRRLKSKIGAMERARLARELHDGVIQSLIGLEMHLGAAKLQKSGQAESELLAGIESALRKEIQSLRELTNQLRSVNVGPGELVPFLVGLTDRFSRDTGIAARVLSDAAYAVSLPELFEKRSPTCANTAAPEMSLYGSTVRRAYGIWLSTMTAAVSIFRASSCSKNSTICAQGRSLSKNEYVCSKGISRLNRDRAPDHASPFQRP